MLLCLELGKLETYSGHLKKILKKKKVYKHIIESTNTLKENL